MEALVDVYLQSKQIDKAESLIGEALKADPGNADALVLLGSIALAKNDPAQAVKHFEMAIKQQPKSAAGYRALADLYSRQKKNQMTLLKSLEKVSNSSRRIYVAADVGRFVGSATRLRWSDCRE